LATIRTYPKMNKTIKELLRKSEDPFKMYILQRITELEQLVQKQQEEITRLKETKVT